MYTQEISRQLRTRYTVQLNSKLRNEIWEIGKVVPGTPDLWRPACCSASITSSCKLIFRNRYINLVIASFWSWPIDPVAFGWRDLESVRFWPERPSYLRFYKPQVKIERIDSDRRNYYELVWFVSFSQWSQNSPRSLLSLFCTFFLRWEFCFPFIHTEECQR